MPLLRRRFIEKLEPRRLLSSTAEIVHIINSPPSTDFPTYPTELFNAGGTLYFQANDGIHGSELWKSDGTSAGTSMVADISPGEAGSFPRLTNGQAAFANGILYFSAEDSSDDGYQVWRTDGTAAGTKMLTNVDGEGHANSVDGADLSGGGLPGFTIVNGKLFFGMVDADHGTELWVSDGTVAGTKRLTDINPGQGGSFPFALTNLNNTLYFIAYNGSGSGLWKSDGTTGGTTEIKQFSTTGVSDYLKVNNTLYFVLKGGASGDDLWKTDGTKNGTILVKHFSASPEGIDVGGLAVVNGVILFDAYQSGDGQELFKSDGTTAGTKLLLDINPGADDSSPQDFTTGDGGRIFFNANDGVHGAEPWTSDGTAAGTHLVKDIFPGPIGGGGSPLGVNVNGTAFFGGFYATKKSALFQYSSATGVSRVDGISNSGTDFTNVNGSVFFVADDSVHGTQLWVIPQTDFASVSSGVLSVRGTILDDKITLALNGPSIEVTRDGISRSVTAASVTSIVIAAGDGNDTVSIGSGILGAYIDGGTGNDLLSGGDGKDTLSGGAGKNTLLGNGGDDRLNGSSGRDSLVGGAGNDRLYGNAGDDTLDGGAGVDRLFGGDGNDLLFGGGSDDKLYGEAGNDTLNGQGQADLNDGGSGTDTAVKDVLDVDTSIEKLI
jgi:ELWxxDGT repeat protein